MKTSTRTAPVRWLPLVAALSIALAGCSGAGAGDAPAVEIEHNAFVPGDVHVEPGEAVTWTNRDAVPHTVTFTDEELGGSDQLAEGDSFGATFDTPGTYAYVCALHPAMQGTVTVAG